MRRTAVKALVLISALTSLALSLPNGPPALQPYPGTGMFLLLSDIHFDPYADPAIVEKLGAKLKGGCPASGSASFAKYGSDTNYPLLKSALDHVVATAAENHIHYDYVIVTGDFLAHSFDGRYRQCVGGGDEAYQKFASDTIRFVDSMIAKALPGVPVFAALGNNDSDRGDYEEPSKVFLQKVGRDWSRAWGDLPVGARATASASFERAGDYAVPDPTAPNHEFVILNSNRWAARNAQACGETDPDPGGQFQWLEDILGKIKRAGGTATLVMHILPGIDALRSSMGQPQSLWTDRCSEKFVAELTNFRGEVREIYAGHIHRDDFRILPDREGKPLLPIHVVPSISPVYFNNPAVEIGWYDKSSGELRDYAPLYLDLTKPTPAWTTEYTFSRAYGRPRPNLAALKELSLAIHEGNPHSGVGEKWANYYAVGTGPFLTPDNWTNYSCAQTEITLSRFTLCKRAVASPKP
ncbi:MAG: metallophosphoesterase [Terriglobia bacterium]